MIPVVDIFAGPGGLGEGFIQAGFNIILSAEMDIIACQTLTLRKFFHKFPPGNAPESYYEYMRGMITLDDLVEEFPEEWDAASSTVAKVELGTEQGNADLYSRLDTVLSKHDCFILIGGPPCQAYSLAGRSRKLGSRALFEDTDPGRGEALRQKLAEEFYKDCRHTLYLEYLKILCRYQPSYFIMENVKGMASAKINAVGEPGSVFNNICEGLRNPHKATGLKTAGNTIPIGYRLYSVVGDQIDESCDIEIKSSKECIIRSEEYGVPQARHRIIIVGIRADINGVPNRLPVADKKVTVSDAISTLPELRSGLSKEQDSSEKWICAISGQIDNALRGQTDFNQEIDDAQRRLVGAKRKLNRGGHFISGWDARLSFSEELHDALYDHRLRGVVQHETRSHIRSDLLRYFFCSTFGETYHRSPKLSDWQGNLKAMLPAHSNIWINGKRLKTNTHQDRFKVQLWSQPSSTIVSHISKDGHYFIHPDPKQCRSMTVREAARLQTFPDNYYFCGNRTQQYHQVGNAVPVLLAKKIAGIMLCFMNVGSV